MDYDCDRCINDCYLDNQQVDLTIPECVLCLDNFRIQCQFGSLNKSMYKQEVQEKYIERKRMKDLEYGLEDSTPSI